MRRGHLILIFVLFFMVLSLDMMEKSWQYDTAAEQKKKIDEALVFAADAAAEQLAMKYPGTNSRDYLESAEQGFFRALSAGLDIYDEFDQMELLDFYVPLLIVTDTEGFYINYLSEGEQDGAKILERIWTECQPYWYADSEYIYRFYLDDEVHIIRQSNPEDIIVSTYREIKENASLMSQLSGSYVFSSDEAYRDVKRAAIAESIEKAAGRMMKEHNYIAGQYGIAHYYGVPSFLEGYTPALEYPSLLAVFQGYPLSVRYNLIYNNCTSSAAYITRKGTYTVELSDSISQPFSVYHREGCTAIGTYGTVLEEKKTKEDAVSLYGAYACPGCFTEDDAVAILP